jgi:hypothetical protein
VVAYAKLAELLTMTTNNNKAQAYWQEKVVGSPPTLGRLTRVSHAGVFCISSTHTLTHRAQRPKSRRARSAIRPAHGALALAKNASVPSKYLVDASANSRPPSAGGQRQHVSFRATSKSAEKRDSSDAFRSSWAARPAAYLATQPA